MGLKREESSKESSFFNSFCRGFIDDTTFGASSYVLGQHNHSCFYAKTGYYLGTGCSMTAGLVYGGTWLKGARYGGKVAISAYRFTRGVCSLSKTTKSAMGAKNVIKLTSEPLSVAKKVFVSIRNANRIVKNKGASDSARFLFNSWNKGTFPNRMQSIRYHFNKHGNGRSITEYTEDAMLFFYKNKNLGKQVFLKNGQEGISIKMRCQGSRIGEFWTKNEKIITYWD